MVHPATPGVAKFRGGELLLLLRKIDWGGAGQIPEALSQHRCGSFLPINRYFFG